jgi:hypothetical protein
MKISDDRGKNSYPAGKRDIPEISDSIADIFFPDREMARCMVLECIHVVNIEGMHEFSAGGIKLMRVLRDWSVLLDEYQYTCQKNNVISRYPGRGAQ